MITFWNDEHPLSAKANELFTALVPDEGHCETLQGEMLRASTKISYDWFNNGWGCNNWSGAVVFISKYYHLFQNPLDKFFIDELMLTACLNYVHGYSHGEPCTQDYDGKVCETVTKIHEIIINTIIANPEPIANPCDMYDLQESQYNDYSEDDDESW